MENVLLALVLITLRLTWNESKEKKNSRSIKLVW